MAQLQQQGSKTLKVGILLDVDRVQAWQARIVEGLCCASFVEPFVIRQPVRPAGNWLNRLKGVPFWLYELTDYWVFRRKRHLRDALALTNIAPLVQGLPVNRLDWFSLDVLVDLRMSVEPLCLEKLPTFGVWRLHQGDRKIYSGEPSGFWEMFDGASTLGSTLTIRTPECGEERVLYRSYAKSHAYSLFLSRNEPCWKSTTFILRRLEDLQQYGWSYLTSLDVYRNGVPLPPTTRDTPGPLAMAAFLGRIAWRFFHAKREKLFNQYQYTIGYRRKRATLNEADLSGFSSLTPPRSEFWADPFLFTLNNRHYLFFENYPYAQGKGVISVAELCPDGTFTPPTLALERPYHLSYPHIVTLQGQIYMIPETSQNRTIELYRAIRFPYEWVLEKVLMDNINAQDVTIFEHGNKFWLFASIVEEAGSSVNDELFLFYADSLFGEWTPHPGNPVVSDVRTARPAGNLFYRNGRIIRPSQDCSKRYGYALNFNQVDVLSVTAYRETLRLKITPDNHPDYQGIHTYNANEAFEVIDLGRSIKR